VRSPSATVAVIVDRQAPPLGIASPCIAAAHGSILSIDRLFLNVARPGA
jgi:hypothetical protein